MQFKQYFNYRSSVIIADLAGCYAFEANANRIDGPNSGGVRCSSVARGGNICAIDRDEGLADSCITQAEYNSLEAYGSYLTFNKRAELLAWCACGCFEASTKIYGLDPHSKSTDYFSISKILPNFKKYKVVSLAPDSKFQILKRSHLTSLILLRVPTKIL